MSASEVQLMKVAEASVSEFVLGDVARIFEPQIHTDKHG
jgi:hypothetical protein